MDKIGAVYFYPNVFCISFYTIFAYQARRKRALLESNLLGITLMADENVNQWVASASSPLIFSEAFYTFKNSFINFFFLSNDKPLWFRSLFFRLAKCPSIALVVLGMPSS
jgi:hypothetical protein